MQNRDTYQRHTGLLQEQGGTRPLAGGGTRPLVDQAALQANTTAILTKGRQSLQSLEPRIEILLRACVAAKLPVPGVTQTIFRHPLTPKSEQLVGYVGAKVTTDPEMAKKVRITVFRFHDAANVVERAQRAIDEGTLNTTLVEELKLKLVYLSHLHAEFKGEPVLSQMFPPPVTSTTSALNKPGTAPMSTVERLKLKQAREAVLHKAEILAGKLAPKMEIIKLTLEMLQQPKSLNVGAMFTPTSRQARLLAMSIGADRAVVAQLQEAFKLYGKLQEELKNARKGGELEPLKEVLFPLGNLALNARKHAMLKDLFPFGEQELFPDEPAAPPPSAETTSVPAVPATPTRPAGPSPAPAASGHPATAPPEAPAAEPAS